MAVETQGERGRPPAPTRATIVLLGAAGGAKTASGSRAVSGEDDR